MALRRLVTARFERANRHEYGTERTSADFFNTLARYTAQPALTLSLQAHYLNLLSSFIWCLIEDSLPESVAIGSAFEQIGKSAYSHALTSML
jgi:hypothetical protein